MPELPDLEVMREGLDRRLVGREILAANAYSPSILKTASISLEELVGERFAAVSRRGKHLILTCRDDLHVVVHLMLAGRLVIARGATEPTKATAFGLAFDDGSELRIVENGGIKLAKVYLVGDPIDVPAIASLGVEPLSEMFTVAYLKERLVGLRRQLKGLITDQRVIAGIGTAYADEILFEARLSPIRYASALTDEEIERLHRAIMEVLRRGIEEIRSRSDGVLLAEGSRDFMRVYKRTGQPCPVCGGRIAEIRYAQKRTYYCPNCQSKGRAIPDRRSWMKR